MDSKKLAIICLFIVAIACVSSFLIINDKQTELTVVSDSYLKNGEVLAVKLMGGGVGLADRQVTVVLTDANGAENILNLTTNDAGIANVTLGGVTPGTYKVKCIYDGEFGYKADETESSLTVVEESSQTAESTGTSTSASSSKSSSTSSSSEDYDPTRDDSHQHATKDNPVTVQQSDGVYTYYGPGHYDYYAGDNHMSGQYYQYRKYNG